ncbi:MAG: PhnD/SsuA/transferrin family substrate-binding protein [Acidobacteriota bacterium]
MPFWRSVFAGGIAVVLLAAAPAAGEPGGTVHRFGVVNFYNPRLMYLKYQPLVDYLVEQTGLEWELVLSSSYEQTVVDLCAGRLDVAYLGPYTYARAHELCGAQPVVQLRTNGKLTYQGVIMVRTGSRIRGIPDLKGTRMGFGAPLSTSSHLVVRGMLARAGLQPGRDVACRYFLHHDRAARAVLLGEVEACAVRDIVGEKFIQRGLRVLAASDPISNFPLVISPGREPQLRGLLVDALVAVPGRDPKVKAEIAGWDEELAGGFSPCSDADFESVRVLARQVFGPLALTAPESTFECSGGRP